MSCYSKRHAHFILIGTLLLGCFPTNLSAQAKVGSFGVPFLLINNSARGRGMGDCVINNVGPESRYYNPGAMGLYHLDQIFSVSFPNNTEWLPELADDLRLKSWGFSAGASKNLIWKPEPNSKLNAALAVAYTKLELDYGEITVTDSLGQPVDMGNPTDQVEVYSVAAGFDYYVRLGAGIGLKKIKSDMSGGVEIPGIGYAIAEVDSWEYGLIGELPLRSIAPHKIAVDGSSDYYLSFDITPSLAFVETNMGSDSLVYSSTSRGDPLPKLSRTGVGLYAAVNINEHPLFSIRTVSETERILVGYKTKNWKNGYEFGLFGCLYYRAGEVNFYGIENPIHTYGLGFSLQGAVQWFRMIRQSERRAPHTEYLLDHLDVTFDFAKVDGGVLDTRFFRVSLSF